MPPLGLLIDDTGPKKQLLWPFTCSPQQWSAYRHLSGHEGYAIWINAECLSEDGVEQFEYSTMNLSSETRIRQGRRVSRVGDISDTDTRRIRIRDVSAYPNLNGPETKEGIRILAKPGPTFCVALLPTPPSHAQSASRRHSRCRLATGRDFPTQRPSTGDEPPRLRLCLPVANDTDPGPCDAANSRELIPFPLLDLLLFFSSWLLVA